MYGDEVAGKRFSSCFFAILTENKSSYCSMLYCFLPKNKILYYVVKHI